MKLCFLDTETTSLRPDRRAWDIALILRENGKDEEHQWFIDRADLDLGNADLMSLKIGHFHQRHPEFNDTGDPWATISTAYTAARDIEQLTRGATIVGAVPNFDTEVLGNMLRGKGICPAWHYHLIDVETLAAGALKLPPPWSFDSILDAYGLAYDEKDRHTALGDTRMARDLYDAVLGKTEA